MIAAQFDTNGNTVDPAQFKLAMRHLAGAVSVITVGTGAERTGFTATSVSSFSVDPPTLLASLNRSSSSWEALLSARAFAVNILSAEQAEIANRFAGIGGEKGEARYAGANWRAGLSGSGLLDGALVTIDCELEEAIERHSHSILLGRVLSVAVNTTAAPLTYFNGNYTMVAPTRTKSVKDGACD